MDKISIRCGKGSCRNYDPHNKVSKCCVYSDRKDCPMSNKQRRKSANKSRRQNID